MTVSTTVGKVACGEGHIYRGQPYLHNKGVGPSVPKIFGTPYLSLYHLTKTDQVSWGRGISTGLGMISISR